MVKKLELRLDKITKISNDDGDVFKVVLKKELFDETDINLNLRLTFIRGIPDNWREILGDVIGDRVIMTLSSKSQQTKLEV